MKAVTIWQPWASLIMAGAKPYEFRHWPAPRYLVGATIVIHAGARAVRPSEIADLLLKLRGSREDHTGLLRDVALPLLESWHTSPGRLPLASGLGTAVLGQAVNARELFGNDSNRDEHFNFAWPLTEVAPFDHPVPALGAQGFWNWPGARS